MLRAWLKKETRSLAQIEVFRELGYDVDGGAHEHQRNGACSASSPPRFVTAAPTETPAANVAAATNQNSVISLLREQVQKNLVLLRRRLDQRRVSFVSSCVSANRLQVNVVVAPPTTTTSRPNRKTARFAALSAASRVEAERRIDELNSKARFFFSA